MRRDSCSRTTRRQAGVVAFDATNGRILWHTRIWEPTRTTKIKLVAGRPQDLLDMETVVRRQGARLNLARIRRWAVEFAEIKEDPDLVRPFEAAVRKAGL